MSTSVQIPLPGFLLKPRMSAEEWNVVPEMIKSGDVLDISSELPRGFLMYGQWMDARILYQGKKYNCARMGSSGRG